MKKISLPADRAALEKLRAGDAVLLSATIYSLRDKAHALLLKSGSIPEFLRGGIIYYMGPTPARPNKAVGSCGPTTSARMDKYTPTIVKKTGIIGIIGKGERSAAVNRAMKGRTIYFLAYAGLGALCAQSVLKSEAVLYKELGAEAIFRLEVKDFPLIVCQDLKGDNIYGGIK